MIMLSVCIYTIARLRSGQDSKKVPCKSLCGLERTIGGVTPHKGVKHKENNGEIRRREG